MKSHYKKYTECFFSKTINRKETYTNILNFRVTVNNNLFLHRQKYKQIQDTLNEKKKQNT